MLIIMYYTLFTLHTLFRNKKLSVLSNVRNDAGNNI